MREVKDEEEKRRKKNRTRQKAFLITATGQVNNGKAKGARDLQCLVSCCQLLDGPTQIRYLGQPLVDIVVRRRKE